MHLLGLYKASNRTAGCTIQLRLLAGSLGPSMGSSFISVAEKCTCLEEHVSPKSATVGPAQAIQCDSWLYHSIEATGW